MLKRDQSFLPFPGMRMACDSYLNWRNQEYFESVRGARAELFAQIREGQSRERCFIVGNGPSLTMSDLQAISEEDCFGANHIYKLFDKTSWRPKYYVLQDRYTK